MFKKFVSSVLLSVIILSLVACAGGSIGKKGTILTNTNVQNYLDLSCEYDIEMRNFKNFRIICKSKNSLFKFKDATCNVQIITKYNYNKAYPVFDVYEMVIDENGNGYFELDKNKMRSVRGDEEYYVNVDSCTGQVFE